MRHARDRPDHDRLVHPLGNDFADARLARRPRVLRRQRWRLRRRLSILGCLLGHKLVLLLRLWFCGGNGLWLLGPLRKNRVDPRHIAPHQKQPAWLLELDAMLFQTQMKTFLTETTPFGLNFVVARLNYFFSFL